MMDEKEQIMTVEKIKILLIQKLFLYFLKSKPYKNKTKDITRKTRLINNK